MDATYIATEVEPLGVVPGKLLIEAYKFNLLPDAVCSCTFIPLYVDTYIE
jgi:hypothetical protein